jgi:hypothetical protein
MASSRIAARPDARPFTLESTWALHTIASAPLDADVPLLQQYPAMKLGVRESVLYYAARLVPLAERAIAAQPECMQWVLTSPPLRAIPAAANLLAAEVHRRLGERVSSGVSIREAQLRYLLADPQGTFDRGQGHEYSKSGVEERVRNQQRIYGGEAGPRVDPGIFRDRAVLFVNDINVTGTQQNFVRQALETAGPAGIHWLYVVEIEAGLGRSHPELEHALNSLRLGTFEELAALVMQAEVDVTARCVARLLAGSAEQLRALAGSLSKRRRDELVSLAIAEGAYESAEDRAKLALLGG